MPVTQKDYDRLMAKKEELQGEVNRLTDVAQEALNEVDRLRRVEADVDTYQKEIGRLTLVNAELRGDV